jgi:fatty-acyl-CoA synthase
LNAFFSCLLLFFAFQPTKTTTTTKHTHKKSLGVEVRHLWGMTETSPLGSLSGVKASLVAGEPLTRGELMHLKTSQGRPHALCDMRIVDDGGAELARDGAAVGRLQVKGPIVVGAYHRHPPGVTLTADGWFDTGDVATLDGAGYMRITDRSKVFFLCVC